MYLLSPNAGWTARACSRSSRSLKSSAVYPTATSVLLQLTNFGDWLGLRLRTEGGIRGLYIDQRAQHYRDMVVVVHMIVVVHLSAVGKPLQPCKTRPLIERAHLKL